MTKAKPPPYVVRVSEVGFAIAFEVVKRSTKRERKQHIGRTKPSSFSVSHGVDFMSKKSADSWTGRMSDRDLDGDKRLTDIECRIVAIQERQNQGEEKKDGRGLPAGIGAIMGRVATELVAGVIVGALIGWMLDNWLGTSPLFLVLLFFLGAMAGMLNVWRMFSGRGLAVGYFDEHRGSSEKE